MAGGMISNWWGRMRPYYTKAFPEIFVGLGIMTVVYYKLSFGGKKAVDDKPSH